VPYTSHPDLSQKAVVRKLLAGFIQKVNTALPEKTRVKKFIVLHKDFDPDEAELTRTRKLRRDYMELRYERIVSAMYDDLHDVDVETTITYRDGRKATMNVPISIEKVEG